MARSFLSAEWRWLVMLNYEVDPAVVRPYLPRGVEVDAWEGRVLVSMVGFRFLRTRVLGVAVPGHIDFDEVNLRFYVRRETAEGPRRGVVFVKEIVPRWAIARVARSLYDEPYVALPMRHEVVMPAVGRAGLAAYEWKFAGRWHRLAADFEGEPALPAPGSQGEFITEHYWGYTPRRDGTTSEYRVEHPAWRVWEAADSVFEADVGALYGPAWVAPLAAPPVSAFVAEGSAVAVYRGGSIS